MEYRILTEMHDLEVLCELEREIWASPERELAPIVVRVSTLRGGLAIGAYDSGRMIGMLWAFPALRGSECILWSFVAGVLPEYRGANIGFELKQIQRRWALERGYRVVGWTFDSMRSQNANFNLRRLGAYVQDFIPNLYGEINDALNVGLPTDRYEVTWDLRDPRVEAAARGEIIPAYSGDPLALPSLLAFDSAQVTAANTIPDGLAGFRLEIPGDYAAVMRDRPDLGRPWQTALRELSMAAFKRGFRAVDVVRESGRCWYVLTLQPE